MPTSGTGDAEALATAVLSSANSTVDYDSLESFEPNAQSTNEHAPSPESDAEWQAIRVQRYPLTRYIITSAVAVTANSLFRHEMLNPRDVYLPPDKRRELEGLLRGPQRELLNILRVRHEIAAKEMAELRAKSGTATVTLPRGTRFRSGVLPPEASGYNMIQTIGDTVHMANRDMMPGSSLGEAVMHEKGRELLGLIVVWFCREGTITSEEAKQLLSNIQGRVTWDGK